MATRARLLEIAERIIGSSPQMRFVAIIDLKGSIVEGIMRKGKSSLESQREEEHFCRQVAKRRAMRAGFDRTLGRVVYVHVERERVSQLVVYARRHTIFITVEPQMSLRRKVALVNSVKRLVSKV